ncbi:hypothetical protein VCRA2113O325_110127 [Vibrio crassostreae]|nr:hypothetical protein VCRA2113O322_110036 [Vibrio crassostreae]CAK1715283.1 hypothetical protein VCRA2113O326_110048 [Vibrio crassostreae]CAK2534994.1 hypothetical protein VCRA2113O321_110048 [Vibrio crassostreae]CAK2539806.1 hypothetical protein VCRA2113O323_110127 [Vibrio crassostreae]CAK2593782.1 hypothetical protein VCRA2113O325_110127 [Vibrio crassostreae]
MLKLITLVLMSFTLVGCGLIPPTPLTDEANIQARQMGPIADKANVYFIYSPMQSGMGEITIDGEYLGSIYQSEMMNVHLDEGYHEVIVQYTLVIHRTLKQEFKAGENYYFQVKYNGAFAIPYLTKLTQEEAEELISKANLMPPERKLTQRL